MEFVLLYNIAVSAGRIRGCLQSSMTCQPHPQEEEWARLVLHHRVVALMTYGEHRAQFATPSASVLMTRARFDSSKG